MIAHFILINVIILIKDIKIFTYSPKYMSVDVLIEREYIANVTYRRAIIMSGSVSHLSCRALY